MGGHYGTIHVRTDDQQQVRAAVASLADERTKRFLIAPPIKGWVTVFPEHNGQDDKISAALAAKLKDKILIHCLVHDDDLFAYWYFENGVLKDQYNSCPTYFDEKNPPPRGGNARAFSHLLRNKKQIPELQAVLDGERRTIELERQDEFAAFLGLPNTDHAYEYLQVGEHDGVKSWKKFIHVPDLTAAKAAKSEAKKKEQAERKRLAQSGTLWVDELAKNTTHRLLFEASRWVTDPATSEVFQQWWNNQTRESRWRRFAGPGWKGEDWTSPVVKNAGQLQFSPAGRWCAVVHDQHRTIELWDWRQQKRIMEKTFPEMLGAIAFSADETICYAVTEDKLQCFSLDGSQKVTSITMKARQLLAVAPHPNGQWLAIGQGGVLCLFDIAATNARLLGIGGLFDITPLMKKSFSPEKFEEMMSKAVAAGTVPAEEIEKMRRHFTEQMGQPQFQAKEPVYAMQFSPDGHWLICTTREGVRVFAWPKLLETTAATATPDVSANTEPAPPEADLGIASTMVCAFTYDPARSRVLFGGLQGTVQYLDLSSGKSGNLLTIPEQMPASNMSLTHDRSALVLNRFPLMVQGDVARRGQFQIWNYAALCKAAGLDF